ncbi:MAG: hypothetical protein JW882_00905 [Deltaproteobacteria bacterium]|nr:hypothetical protein [Deltaproteobacteria bacterium]
MSDSGIKTESQPYFAQLTRFLKKITQLAIQEGGAPPTGVGGANAPASAKPAEVPFPHLSAVIMADSTANWSWRLSAKAGKMTQFM